DRQNENEDLCWTVGLATIIYSMNLSVCRATNKRPFELVFDHEPRGNYVLIDQLWSQGVRYEENIPDDVQIEYYDDIQFDDNEEESIQKSLLNDMTTQMVCIGLRLNEYYSAIELIPVTGTFREYLELAIIPNTCVSAREAAI
ncbi:7035_t:CDS:2, partial [Racocetra fulgida]